MQKFLSGTRVWNSVYGKGTVQEYITGGTFPVRVKFDDCSQQDQELLFSFTEDGKKKLSDKYPCLFIDEPHKGENLMKRNMCIVLYCIPLCFFALFCFAIYWEEHASTASTGPQSAEDPPAIEEVPTLLPMTSGIWVKQADLQIMELAHGWIVKRSPANGGGLAFVPKPKSE
jgi:hypothetical protein